MKGELMIKKNTDTAYVDAWDVYGVNMGEGFLSAIDSVPALKDFVESQSRLEHGKRVVIANPRVESADLTLAFTISGHNKGTDPKTQFLTNKQQFLNLLTCGGIDIQVPPAFGTKVFHLIYKGKNASYALNRSRTFCKLSAKFEEPNPTNRS